VLFLGVASSSGLDMGFLEVVGFLRSRSFEIETWSLLLPMNGALVFSVSGIANTHEFFLENTNLECYLCFFYKEDIV
jgi:hypothetical protein